MEEFTSIDLILGTGVGLGAISGVVRGLAIATAWVGCIPLGDILVDKLNVLNDNRVLLAFILLFAGTSIVLWGVRVISRTMADFSFKGPWERLGGLLLGSLKNTIGLTLLLLYTAYAQPLLSYDTLIGNSHFGSLVEDRLLPQYEKFAEDHPEWYLPPSWISIPTGTGSNDDQSRNQGRDPIQD
jgi:hypothetical protein